MTRGVGALYDKKVVRSFGEKVFDVIEVAPGLARLGVVR
jgi:hypothetical protein